MQYFKIYHENVRVHKAYYELSKEQFDVEAGDYAAENTPDYEDENGQIDFDACEKAMDKIIDRIKEEAKGYSGFDMGDYSIYIRDYPADMYEIARG